MEENNSVSLTAQISTDQQRLREMLRYFVAQLQPPLQDDVMRALKEPGKIFACNSGQNDERHLEPPAGYWALFPLAIAQTIEPGVDMLIPGTVAVALECFICALDLLDDVEDDDDTAIMRELGSARVLNTSTALLGLTQRIVLSLMPENASLIIRILDVIQNEMIIAATGQHKDLLSVEQDYSEFTYEKCIKIAEEKGGSLVSLVFRLGALCGGANDAICEKFAELGKLLGVAQQLDNDSHNLYHVFSRLSREMPDVDVNPAEKKEKSDLSQGKKTLPIVLMGNKDARLQEIYQLKGEKMIYQEILSTYGICLLYQQRAFHLLQEIKILYPLQQTLQILMDMLL